MPVGTVNSLAGTIGGTFADTDRLANRLRTEQEDRLRQIVANRMARSKGLSESLAAQGLSHSSVHLEGQADIAKQSDRSTAQSQQRFTDSLTNLARRRISEEASFNINNSLPR